MSANDSGLDRFRTAQASPDAGFEAAMQEIRDGRKMGHWILYILPQLVGLGTSSMSRAFALRDQAEATEYLRDPELGARLLAVVAAIADQLATRPGQSVAALMGSDIDARKLVSSLTLFEHVASQLGHAEPNEQARAIGKAATQVLRAADAEGYARCTYTLGHLDR